jgi:hypothetical protein
VEATDVDNDSIVSHLATRAARQLTDQERRVSAERDSAPAVSVSLERSNDPTTNGTLNSLAARGWVHA